jgi:putative nucleotidyltransferase with HDIG domain
MVIVLGVGSVVAASLFTMPANLLMLGILVLLAAVAELQQISVYEDSSISVSMAITITAGFLGGIPGVALVSAGIAVADQMRRRRPLRESYKIAFNWATHVVAGLIIPLALSVVSIDLSLQRLPLLLVITLVTTLVYYGIETGLISGAISLSQRTHVLTTWRSQFRWLAGHYLVLGFMGLCLSVAYTTQGVFGALIFALPVLMLRYAQAQYVTRTEASVLELKRMNRELVQANQEVVAASQAIQHLNDDLFQTLGTILDTRDPYVGGHVTQVARYASTIAKELGLSEDRVEVIRQAGFLHDIGKMAIPEQILYKPGKLTDVEYQIIQTHAAVGAAMLEGSTRLRHLAPIVRCHHERWDGRGYPDGLMGDNIPLEARILNVCDSVEAMAADRPYHAGMPLPAILEEVKRCAGTQFDPAIAATFIRIAEREGERLVINSAQEVLRKQGQIKGERSAHPTDCLHEEAQLPILFTVAAIELPVVNYSLGSVR